MNAPVAPSPCLDELGGADLSTGRLGEEVGVGTEVTIGVGVGATKTGSDSGVVLTGGAVGKGSGAAGITSPGTRLGVLNVDWGVPMSLKIDVKLGSDVPAGTADSGAGGEVWPNTAVNSPTLFFGGSTGSDENDGMSADLSP
ncbi:MAG TPA: hypothetical protein VMS18_17010 [Candidatus Binatia bacterium]|nr:hypothetical protein [Candidatus Binatia bacterium]